MSKIQFTQKQKLAVLDSAKQLGIKEASRLAGVHYTTVYEWRRQLNALGKQAFLDHEPSYPGRGIKKITPEKEKAILDTWNAHPGYGPGQVRNQLRRQGTTISIGTIRKIMGANGYKAPTKKTKKDACRRFEARRPLELAQMDICEFFVNKLKVYMILLLDDFSRFILGWRLLEQTSIDSVIDLVAKAIDRYGKVEQILTDRGFVFYSWRGVNRFEQYLELQGIDQIHARPHHPQTLGKVEACNKRIKAELFGPSHFSSLHEAASATEKWVNHYNYNRPHQGLGGLLTPAERFHGQAQKVLCAMDQGIDITAQNGYGPIDIQRSILNVVLDPGGGITLYLLGRPVVLSGGANG